MDKDQKKKYHQEWYRRKLKEDPTYYARLAKKRDEYHSVYYLPLEHYAGVTNKLSQRMSSHRRYGLDPTGYKILFATKDRLEAHVVEAELHLMGINGHNDMPFVKQLKPKQ